MSDKNRRLLEETERNVQNLRLFKEKKKAAAEAIEIMMRTGKIMDHKGTTIVFVRNVIYENSDIADLFTAAQWIANYLKKRERHQDLTSFKNHDPVQENLVRKPRPCGYICEVKELVDIAKTLNVRPPERIRDLINPKAEQKAKIKSLWKQMKTGSETAQISNEL